MPNPAVFVFGMAGCPACEDYMPRFKDACARTNLACPIGIYDLAKDKHANEFASRLGVQATPTTVVMDRRGKLHKFVGALADSKIVALLRQAVG